jgi:hypothetical protein
MVDPTTSAIISNSLLAYEIRSEPIGIPCVVVVRVAVGVDIAEVVTVVVIRRTLPPIRSRTHRRKIPTDRFNRNTPITFKNLSSLVAFQHIGQQAVLDIN